MLDFVGTVEAAELPSGDLVVSAHGPLDERIAPILRDALIPLASADGARVVLDLEDAHGLDEATLDVVGRAAHLVSCRGERLGIVTRSPFVTALVVDCGLDDIVTVYRSLREAVAVD